MRKFLCDSEEEDNAQGEDVQLAGVHWGHVLRLPGLWGHVHPGTRESGQLPAQLLGVDDPGHTKISNLCDESRVEEDIPGRKVTVHDGWVLAVQVEETSDNVMKDRQLDGHEDPGVALQHVVEVVPEKLHYQHREVGGWEETDAQELYDVGVAKVL